MEKLGKIPMNLQFFAEQDDGAANDTGSDTNAETQPGANASQTDDGNKPDKPDSTKPALKYSDKDVDAIVQKKLARWKSEQEQDKKLAEMSDDERSKAEIEMAKNEAASAKDELSRYKMQDTARSLLSDAGINVPSNILDLIVTKDAETTKPNVDAMIDFVKSVKEDAKREFLKGKVPSIDGKKVNGHEESLGARLAKANVSARPNPYFKTETK